MSILRSVRHSVTFLIGGLGAGKTELALHLAILCARRLHADDAEAEAGPASSAPVHLLDLDIVNPFFRVRKLAQPLTARGVHLVCPVPRIANGDLPALPSEVWGSLERHDTTIVCDVGGGGLGLRPLARLRESAERRQARVFFVVNCFRPEFLTLAEMKASFARMAELSSLKVTHLVANPNLAEESSADVFQAGLARIRDLSAAVSVPIAFAMATPTTLAGLGAGAVSEEPGGEPVAWQDLEILPVVRFWETPWRFGLASEGASDAARSFRREDGTIGPYGI